MRFRHGAKASGFPVFPFSYSSYIFGFKTLCRRYWGHCTPLTLFLTFFVALAPIQIVSPSHSSQVRHKVRQVSPDGLTVRDLYKKIRATWWGDRKSTHGRRFLSAS